MTKYTVMVVEDDARYRELLTLLLEGRGYEVIPIATADAAFETFTKKKLDCILLDYCLPDEDGIQLATRIREQDMKIGIIIMTSLDRDLVDVACDGLCIWAVLKKPIEYKILFQSIEDACELSNMAPEVEDRFITAFSVETQAMKRHTKDLLDETGEHRIARK
jgi:DNA-binding response OmpR family regulator